MSICNDHHRYLSVSLENNPDDRDLLGITDDAPPVWGFVVDEELGRNIGYSDPDPAMDTEPEGPFWDVDY